MARKKTVKGKDGAFDLRGLTEGLEGFSLLEDSTFATVEDVLPLLLPQIDSQLAGGSLLDDSVSCQRKTVWVSL